MTQHELDEAVATVTGESICLIQERGFSVANPIDVRYDPEPRRPMVFDWDSMGPARWPLR